MPSATESAIRLKARLLALVGSTADVVAFSGGSYAAVVIALRRSLKVGRLVLVAPAVGFNPDAARGLREVAGATLAGAFDPRPTWLDRMASPESRRASSGTRRPRAGSPATQRWAVRWLLALARER